MDRIVSINGIARNTAVIATRINERNKELAQIQYKFAEEIRPKRQKESIICFTRGVERQNLRRQLALVDERERKELEILGNSSRKITQELERRFRELISPIQKLPAELLNYIFQHFVGLEQSPLMLLRVCKSWKQMALATPRLWSNLCLGKPDHYRRRLFINRLVCRDVEELQWFALLSGKAPLDVVVELNGSHLLPFLLSGPLSQRIVALSIDPAMAFDESYQLIVTPFSQLQHLNFRSSRPSLVDFILSKVLRPSTSLRSLTLASLTPASLANISWSSLRTLQLKKNGNTTPESLNQIIAQLSDVETLAGFPIAWPNVDTPNVTMRAHSMEVTCQPEFLARIALPQIQKLQWTHPGRSRLGTAYVTDSYLRSWSLSFPELVSLTFYGNHGAWLPRFSAPNLQTLRWEDDQTERPDATVDLPVSSISTTRMAKVEFLSYNSRSDEAILLSVLQRVPNVRTLTLSPGEFHPGEITNKWGVDILARLANPVNMLCPRVKRLTFGIRRLGIKTNKSLSLRLIRDVIKFRKKTSRSLEFFEVTWSVRSTNKSPETVQYV